TTNLIDSNEGIAEMLISHWEKWNASVEASDRGADYTEGTVSPDQPERRFWHEDKAYVPFLEEHGNRPQYKEWIEKRKKQAEREQSKQG
ncbi:MAG: hypothetical protein AAF491_11770, partial [Verrucomicrobiota bacterium]